MSLFNRQKKVDPNKMAPEQLEDYVNQLPEEAPPPKWTTVGWCAGGCIIFWFLFFANLPNVGTKARLLFLGGGILSLALTIWLIYKILSYGKEK